MKRQIITIIDEKCNGCGQCVPNCPEGALKVINGKAQLVGEVLCDGLGACIGNCPEGAIIIEEREAAAYDEVQVMENVVKAGEEVVASHLKHLKDHGQEEYFKKAQDFLAGINKKKSTAGDSRSVPSGCPGTMMRDFRKGDCGNSAGQDGSVVLKSALAQWPVQLQLLNPHAPYFQNSSVVVAADCVPFAFANFHERFLKGKTLVILCPKLDTVMDEYLEKFTEILNANNIQEVTVVHMEVPCCSGVVRLVQEAIKQSGKNVLVKDYTISLQGEII